MEFAKEEVEAASGGEPAGGGVAGQQAGGAPPDDAKAQALDALQARAVLGCWTQCESCTPH